MRALSGISGSRFKVQGSMFPVASIARRRRSVTAAVVFLIAAAGPGPALGQPRFDVPFVPTPTAVVDEMLRLAKVGPGDFVMDLGSGDGRVAIAAARKFGARAVGVELDSHLLMQSEESARQAGVQDRVKFVEQNIFEADLSRATVITMYLFPEVNLKLRPRLLTLRPGTRIVSHDFDMAQWEPDAALVIPVPEKSYGAAESQVYLWIVPANAAGTWEGSVSADRGTTEFRAEIEQTFQMVSGTARLGATAGRLSAGRLDGGTVRFALAGKIDGRDVRHEFRGRVDGDLVFGRVTLAGGIERDWRARRVRRGAIGIDPPRPD